jgi:hypothetical protein
MRFAKGSPGRRCSLLALGGLAVLGLWVAPAEAVEIVPGDTAILGESSNAKFVYNEVTITCKSQVGGRTTKPATAIANLTSVTFKECANEPGEYTTEVITNASGANPFKLVATKATGSGNGEGHIEIPTGGTVTVKVYAFLILWCEFTASGPQTAVGTFDNAKDLLTINSTITVKRTGGVGSEEACGPNESTAKFTAEYSTSPENLEIK